MRTPSKIAYHLLVYAILINLGLFSTTMVSAVGANPFEQEVELDSPQLEQDSENPIVPEGDIDSGAAAERTLYAGVYADDVLHTDLAFELWRSTILNDMIHLEISSSFPIEADQELYVSFSWLNDANEVLYSRNIQAFQQGVHIWNVSARVDTRPNSATKYKIDIDPTNQIQEHIENNNTQIFFIDNGQSDLQFNGRLSTIGDETQEIVIYNLGENDTLEDFVSDIVIELLKAIGYDINDYEGECTIEAQYFLDAGLDMGFNYLSLAEDFRDSNV